MGSPRLGTGAGLAALRAQAEGHGGIWPGSRPSDPVRRVLSGPAPLVAKPRRGDVAAIVHAAAELAQQLGPLPAALSTIAQRVRRRCGGDDELGALLEGLEARTFALWQAVTALSLAARRTASKGA